MTNFQLTPEQRFPSSGAYLLDLRMTAQEKALELFEKQWERAQKISDMVLSNQANSMTCREQPK